MMWVAYIALSMGGASCEAVTVCDKALESCEAVVLSCDAPVSLDACLMGGAADMAESEEWIDVLGCSTDLSRGWPATVDLDSADLYWIAGPAQ